MNIDPVDRVVQARTVPAAGLVRSAGRLDAATVRAPVAAETADRAAGEQVRRAIAEANRRLAQKASELTFEFDEDAGRVIVRLIDKHTGEVLRQIPSDEALAIARALAEESAAGALLRADA